MVSTMPAMLGKRERRVQARHRAKNQHQVHHHRDERDQPGEVVIADQEYRDDDQAETARETNPRYRLSAPSVGPTCCSLIGSSESWAGRLPAFSVLIR